VLKSTSLRLFRVYDRASTLWEFDGEIESEPERDFASAGGAGMGRKWLQDVRRGLQGKIPACKVTMDEDIHIQRMTFFSRCVGATLAHFGFSCIGIGKGKSGLFWTRTNSYESNRQSKSRGFYSTPVIKLVDMAGP